MCSSKFPCIYTAAVHQVSSLRNNYPKGVISFPSGHPKPIPQTHEHIVTDTIAVRTNISYVGAPVYAPLPLYHVRSSSLSSNKQLNLSPQRELVSIASPAGLWEQVTFPPLFTPSYL